MKNTILLFALVFAYEGQSQTPELFMPDKISTQYKERDMTISADGNHLLYSIHSFNDDQRMIVEMKKKGKEWKEPQVVSFSGMYKDIEPMFTPDGNRLYFASDRPMFEGDESKDYNIWYVDKARQEWGQPFALDTLINTHGEEFYPSISNKGTLYFTATKEEGIGKEDIYYSLSKNGVFQKPACMDSSINTTTYEFNAFIDPDEKYILFSSYRRPDGLGGGDLYISINKNGNWLPSRNLGEVINSTKLDYCPFVSADGKNFYFTSNRKGKVEAKNVAELRQLMSNVQNGFDDIYFLPVSALGLSPN